MSEPRWLEGDDVAIEDECDSCKNFIYACECEPDPDAAYERMREED